MAPAAMAASTSTLACMFSRAALAFLFFSAVCSTAASCAAQWLLHLPHLWALAAFAALAAELIFAWAWLAKYQRLNAQPALHMPRSATFDGRQAFDKFVADQRRTARWVDIRAMCSAWFGGVPFESLCEDNVAELLAYGFFYLTTEQYEQQYGEPALNLARELQQAWGVRLAPGHSAEQRMMAHLWEPLRCHWRPMAFYLFVELAFLLKHTIMLAMGFTSGSVHGFTYYVYQPAQQQQQEEEEARTPVLFQHGVGLGLLPYVLFVARLASTGRPVAALECAHLGMRWVEHVPGADEVVAAMAALLETRLGWAKACVVGHSYGTFFASRFVQLHQAKVAALCLLDPVCLNMFTGQLVTNFVYAPGKGDKQAIKLIARDIHHAASVARGFFWSDLNLWPEQLPQRSLLVLSGKDRLVPVRETLAMVQHAAPHAKVLHHAEQAHADFLFSFACQERIVGALVSMLDQEDEGEREVGYTAPVVCKAARRQRLSSAFSAPMLLAPCPVCVDCGVDSQQRMQQQQQHVALARGVSMSLGSKHGRQQLQQVLEPVLERGASVGLDGSRQGRVVRADSGMACEARRLRHDASSWAIRARF